tara:strand:+ start:154 stop:330 length:177 start_codon:yes stop_codon:yes gene_type:complete
VLLLSVVDPVEVADLPEEDKEEEEDPEGSVVKDAEDLSTEHRSLEEVEESGTSIVRVD